MTKIEKLKLIELEGDEAVEAMIRMADPTVCPACGRRKADPKAQKAFTQDELTSIGFISGSIAFLGTDGFGGNFFLGVFASLVAFVAAHVIAKAVDRRLGLR